jgi:hypothetical protein
MQEVKYMKVCFPKPGQASRVAMILPALLLVSGCVKRNSTPAVSLSPAAPAPATQDGSSSDGTGGDKNNSEGAISPSLVTGIFLTCVQQGAVSKDKPEAIIGCKHGKKGKPGETPADYSFGFKPPKENAAKSYVVNRPKGQSFDAIYVVKGSSAEQVQSTIDQTVVSAKKVGVDADASDAVVGDKLNKVTTVGTDNELNAVTSDSLIASAECEKAIPSKTKIKLDVVNHCEFDVDAIWVDFQGELKTYGTITKKGGTFSVDTFGGHPWKFFRLDNGLLYETYVGVDEGEKSIAIGLNLCN